MPLPLYPQERPGAHCIGGWVGPSNGLDGCRKSRLHRDLIPGPSSLLWVAIPIALSWPHITMYLLIFLQSLLSTIDNRCCCFWNFSILEFYAQQKNRKTSIYSFFLKFLEIKAPLNNLRTTSVWFTHSWFYIWCMWIHQLYWRRFLSSGIWCHVNWQ